ncbi:hypothetical protein IFO70_22130 [Phormidium tenue FACHB-886]|nr:hypothetical protein [Phormidium tenue FACHB-886]
MTQLNLPHPGHFRKKLEQEPPIELDAPIDALDAVNGGAATRSLHHRLACTKTSI